jgi:4-aminobutyrate aminotransferase-like enzyme
VTNEQLRKWNAEGLLAEVVGYETDEIADSAEGATVTTLDGGDYLDFTSGIAVHACGHTHPEVTAAICAQARRVIHTSDVMKHAPQLELAHWLRELIAARIPAEPWTFQFLNSGSESIDAAAKLAIKATGRDRFISFQGGFHGRTLFATALSCSNRTHWQAYEPFLSALDGVILHAPAPRCAADGPESEPHDCTAGVEAMIERHGSEVAALFFEPQQGEGGYFPMAPHAAQRIRELTRKHGILMIADEIQSGFGRTGRWFAFEHLGIEPDIVVFGKAIGGGLPLAGVGAAQSLMARWKPGEHGTTFGGNPIACAAGMAAMGVIEREGLVERAAALGERIKARLCPLIGRHGVVDVRGNGLMIGLELRSASGEPDYAGVASVKSACRQRGMLVLSCGARIGLPDVDNATIRLLPPLTVSLEDLDRGLMVLADAVQARPAS